MVDSIPGVLCMSVSLLACSPAESQEFAPARVETPGDLARRGALRHTQEWGVLGIDRAASDPRGTPAQPLRVGETVHRSGLGHHANGEITMDVAGRYVAFRSLVGVQWQGGGRGSVVFRILVDGRLAAECGPLSDLDAPVEVNADLTGARELRLVAADAGDGIGCDMANWLEARLELAEGVPVFGPAGAWLNGLPAPQATPPVCGLSLIAAEGGPQLAIASRQGRLTVSVEAGEDVRIRVPLRPGQAPARIFGRVTLTEGESADVTLSLDGASSCRRTLDSASPGLELGVDTAEEGTAGESARGETAIVLVTRAPHGGATVRWEDLKYASAESSTSIPLDLPARQADRFPPPILPDPRPGIAAELVEWDWRMQDGIGTPLEATSWDDAIAITLAQGDALLRDLGPGDGALTDLLGPWSDCHTRLETLADAEATDTRSLEALWRKTHRLRRELVLRNPLLRTGRLLFAKRVPACFSHQLTQYYGKCARPGGGLFVLEEPGRSMRCRALTDGFPPGSVLHPEVSHDGERILFAFCAADSAPRDWQSHPGRHYHLFEMRVDGSGVRQLTDGPFDDFSPRYLPDGNILFLSTRRGGFHRCGGGPCAVYTLAVLGRDGSPPRLLSYHETHEWDPVVLNDGRILYTRWDYVDRNAVFYQQLWTAHPDGTDVRAYFGNNTLNPVGIWESRPVPGSHRVMATAGAHHAMTAGSIILLDVASGGDGEKPITRLTPDALFPESEYPVMQWHAPAGVSSPPTVPLMERRWPGHCYRTPLPLSETHFLAAYSFQALVGEPRANPANMFGLYAIDRFGNKELLYRDLDIGSLWPTPLGPRPRPPSLASTLEGVDRPEGTFFLQNVRESWPPLPAEPRSRIDRLRILQVLPKSTPHINQPRLGLANASPGKQVLGTVPVEADGSAYFRAPAGVPLAFQALDGLGRAVQIMRSVTYLQPGEQASCVGCHEYRGAAPRSGRTATALSRAPSRIAPGPAGSKPLSFPILVQPVLDRHCVRCHAGSGPPGGIRLTAGPAGEFSVSYAALAPLVPYPEWTGAPDFVERNSEPLTRPDTFGARASKLMDMLLEGHEDVELGAEDIERLATWMDANALFYGTFDPADQSRQRRGERIEGPALE